MPYKDKVKATEASKGRMRKHRQGVTKGVTKQGVTGEGVTIILSDGQVYDRANPPKADLTLWSGVKISAMRRCNEAEKMVPLMGQSKLIGSLKAKYDYRKAR